MSLPFWTKELYDELDRVRTYREMYEVARKVIAHMPAPRGQVCGPISTGGAGSVEANLARFNDAIAALTDQGYIIFSQVPFEVPMQKVKKLHEQELAGKYDVSLLNDFYLPLFESGEIHTLYFLTGWESSTGSRWEHEQAERLGITIAYLTDTYELKQ